ncbi:MAG TPA: glycerol-3-phosphate 1-O-acyltransferase PlsY [Phycisphaerales bacterium]|nr:glycerol-3-phosphate 1-O-acyltransferase PlsY [Phycisphaerales bacterium]
MLALAIAIPLAFISGSIPCGLLIARARGVDIRAHGSGNIGATNVWRVCGRAPGLACFSLDVAKGLVPTAAAGLAAGTFAQADLPPRLAWLWLAVAAAAILGHMFTPWAGFRGGKGVATGFGALLGIFPLLTFPALAALVVWLVVARLSRYVSLASIAAAASLPVWLFVTVELLSDHPGGHRAALPFYVAIALLAAAVILKHRGNIGRLLQGSENRIGRRVDACPPKAASRTPPDGGVGR